MTGHQTAMEIRTMEKERDADINEKPLLAPFGIIIACSGNVSAANKELYLNSGIDYVWEKPMPSNKRMFKDLQQIVKVKQPKAPETTTTESNLQCSPNIDVVFHIDSKQQDQR